MLTQKELAGMTLMDRGRALRAEKAAARNAPAIQRAQTPIAGDADGVRHQVRMVKPQIDLEIDWSPTNNARLKPQVQTNFIHLNKEIWALHEEGWLQARIAKQVGCCRKTVFNHLVVYNRLF